MSEIKPALTASEWAEFLEHGRSERLVEYKYGPSQSPDVLEHGLVARLLHGQPFGFTREDVAELRAWAFEFADPDLLDCEVKGFLANLSADQLASLADRIEALLPPEDV